MSPCSLVAVDQSDDDAPKREAGRRGVAFARMSEPELRSAFFKSKCYRHWTNRIRYDIE